MKVIALKCPDCGANIEIEDGRNSCFCTYCGCKVIIDDEKQEKTININKNITHTNHYINEAEVIDAKSRAKNWKTTVTLSILIPVVVILFFVSIIGSAKHASNKEEKKLQSIVDEVMMDIENGDFEEAQIKANTIYYTGNWSDEIENKWDKTRKALLDQIEKAEKKANSQNSILNWFD